MSFFFGPNLKFRTFMLAIFFVLVAELLLVHSAEARTGGGGGGLGGNHSMTLGFSSVSATQGDLNSVIGTVAAQNSITTKELTSAYEFIGQYLYRFSGTMFSLAFRPAYFTSSQSGTGTGGDYSYKLSGYSIFPLLRLYPLENSFIKFFMQGGVGWGKLSTTITQGTDSLAFEGSNFGGMGGLGVDFCFSDSHCLTIEGNMRYLPIVRNMASSATSSPMTGFSQTVTNQEVEVGGRDIDTTMSGIQGLIAYTMNF